PRPERATWMAVIFAILGVGLALIGNVMLNPHYLQIFLDYLIPTLLIVGFMLFRIRILKVFLFFLDYITPDKNSIFREWNSRIKRTIRRINDQQFVFFTKHDDVATLNRVLRYITANEHTRRLKIVTVLA